MPATPETQSTAPDQLAPPKVPPCKRPGRIAGGIRFIAIAWLLLSFALLVLSMSPAVDWLVARLDRQQPLEKSRYIICLGGDPYRVLESATLFNEGWGDILVVSNHDEAADRMQRWAIEWGVPAESIIVDRGASRTRDHPSSVLSATGLDPARDSCLIVTDFTHLARSKACFLKAGFRCIIMREPRWTRALRTSGTPSIKHRLLVVPELVYEGAAWIEYWFRGAV